MQNIYLQGFTEKSRPPAEQKQTQFKANTNPIQTQFWAKQTQFSSIFYRLSSFIYRPHSAIHLDLTLINHYNTMFNEYLSKMR